MKPFNNYQKLNQKIADVNSISTADELLELVKAHIGVQRLIFEASLYDRKALLTLLWLGQMEKAVGYAAIKKATNSEMYALYHTFIDLHLDPAPLLNAWEWIEDQQTNSHRLNSRPMYLYPIDVICLEHGVDHAVSALRHYKNPTKALVNAVERLMEFEQYSLAYDLYTNVDFDDDEWIRPSWKQSAHAHFLNGLRGGEIPTILLAKLAYQLPESKNELQERVFAHLDDDRYGYHLSDKSIVLAELGDIDQALALAKQCEDPETKIFALSSIAEAARRQEYSKVEMIWDQVLFLYKPLSDEYLSVNSYMGQYLHKARTRLFKNLAESPYFRTFVSQLSLKDIVPSSDIYLKKKIAAKEYNDVQWFLSRLDNLNLRPQILTLACSYIEADDIELAQPWIDKVREYVEDEYRVLPRELISLSLAFAKVGNTDKAEALLNEHIMIQIRQRNKDLQAGNFAQLYKRTIQGSERQQSDSIASEDSMLGFVEPETEIERHIIRLAQDACDPGTDRETALALFEKGLRIAKSIDDYRKDFMLGGLLIAMNASGFLERVLEFFESEVIGESYLWHVSIINHHIFKRDYDTVRRLVKDHNFMYFGDNTHFIIDAVVSQDGIERAEEMADLLDIGDGGNPFIGREYIKIGEYVKGLQMIKAGGLITWLREFIPTVPAFGSYSTGLDRQIVLELVNQLETLVPEIVSLRQYT